MFYCIVGSQMLTFSIQNCKVHNLVHIELLCNRFSLKSLESIRYGNILKPLYIKDCIGNWFKIYQVR